MRTNKLLFMFLLGCTFVIITLASSNLPTVLSTQSEIDLFTEKTITGNLVIDGPDITNLDSLYRLTSVDGYIAIRNNPLLTNLDGLSHLDSITGSFVIQKNTSLKNIDGLSNLSFIGGDLTIDSNTVMLSINGFPSIDSIRGNLTIKNNLALTNINGLSNLKFIRGGLTIDSDYALLDFSGISKIDSIGGNITIRNNLALLNIDGLSKIDSVHAGLTLVNNPVLENINGLSNLKFINGGLKIDSCIALQNIDGISKIDSIGGNLAITNNLALANINGLSNLKMIGGGLKIDSDYALLNLDGLSKIDSVRGGLTIIFNSALTNIDGLSNITTIEKQLEITNNKALTNLDGLLKLDSIGTNASGESFKIVDNTALDEFCGLYTLFHSNEVTGTYEISGNASNPTAQEILAAGPCPQSIAGSMQDLIATVQSLPLGYGNMNSLMAKIQGAIQKYNTGDYNTAVNKLSAFINELLSLVTEGKLTSADAQPLIDYANQIIAAINSILPKAAAQSSTIEIPKDYALYQNYPNPFNPTTSIKYAVPNPGFVSLKVYDILGKEVAYLVNENQQPGNYEIKFDASRLSSGMYIYELSAGSHSFAKKMLLIK